MPRRPASIIQADVARSIRTAKQEGAAEVELRMRDQASSIIRLIAPSSMVSIISFLVFDLTIRQIVEDFRVRGAGDADH